MATQLTAALNTAWDIFIGAARTIALLKDGAKTYSGVSALATGQNIANAVRLQRNDALIAANSGIPYRVDFLAQLAGGTGGASGSAAESYLRSEIIAQALGVDNVETAEVDEIRLDRETRRLSVSLHYTTKDGADGDVVVPIGD